MTDVDAFELDRFVEAQSRGTHERAVAELRAGRKASHWMWFVFPQLQGLGDSVTARRYGISGLAEARAYLAHPLLGARLQECASVLETLDESLMAADIFGAVDTLKLRSSLTLFAEASAPASIFERLLTKYFAGHRDEHTVAMLQRHAR